MKGEIHWKMHENAPQETAAAVRLAVSLRRQILEANVKKAGISTNTGLLSQMCILYEKP